MPDARISVSILGLGCGGGGALLLERALARLHGVETVYVNPATGTAHIEYDKQEIAVDALLEEVKRAGYRPGPVVEKSRGRPGDAQSEGSGR